MKQRLASALAVAALSYAAAASGYSRTGGVWRTLPVSWFWNPATVPASLGGMDNGRLAFEAGFTTWSSASCTRFSAVNAGTTTVVRGSTRDRVNTFAWISGAWPAELGAVNSVIGVTLPVSSGGANIDADIIYNAVGFAWSLLPRSSQPGDVDRRHRGRLRALSGQRARPRRGRRPHRLGGASRRRGPPERSVQRDHVVRRVHAAGGLRVVHLDPSLHDRRGQRPHRRNVPERMGAVPDELLDPAG